MTFQSVAFERLVDVDRAKGRFRINRAAYKNPEVFAREKAAIFDKCWLYLGHKSEVVNPGDFVRRTVAGRNLIFTRDRNGEIRALVRTVERVFAANRRGIRATLRAPIMAGRSISPVNWCQLFPARGTVMT